MQRIVDIWANAKPHIIGVLSGMISLLAVYLTLGLHFFHEEPNLRATLPAGSVIQTAAKEDVFPLFKISADKALSGGEKTIAVYEYHEVCSKDVIASNFISTNELGLAEKYDSKLIVGKIYNIDDIALLCKMAALSDEKYVVSTHDLTIEFGDQSRKLQRADVGIKVNDTNSYAAAR
jgi:hypothetical protein